MAYFFITEQQETVPAYIVYALSAYTLTVLAICVPKLVNNANAAINSTKLGKRLMTDIHYRVKLSLYAALFINLIYAILKLLSGIHYASFWFGADAIYYIVLSIAQFFLLRYVRKYKRDLAKEYQIYRFCGYVMFALNAAMTVLVYQVVNQNREYHYPGFMIYVIAVYAFSCLTLAIVNLVKYRKFNSPVLSAVKAISLAKALVAIFALQTAMLLTFGGEESKAFSSLMKTLTGGGVCLIILGMAVYMVVRANKNMNKTIKA